MNIRRPIVCRRAFAGLALALGVVATGGCGGGGGSFLGPGGSPSTGTRAAVKRSLGLNVQTLSLNGAPVPGSGELMGAPGVGQAIPSLGAFMRNVGGASALTRATNIRKSRVARTRSHDEDFNFYYDEWLELWVLIQDEGNRYGFLLFEDHERTKAAGSVLTTWTESETEWRYTSTYSFTAGPLNGSHGSYDSTWRLDGSMTMQYEDVWADGSRSTGSSSYTAGGSYTWTCQGEGPDGWSYSNRGTFNADGSGATHSESSDGYASDFTYNADGSGSGRIAGPDPGLPATIVWDNTGHTVITYADGTKEEYDGWWGFGWANGGVVNPDGSTNP